MIDGTSYSVLDMDTERGAHSNHYASYKPFAERAIEEIKYLSLEERRHRFIIAYSIYGQTFLTTAPDQILRFSLAGQVYNRNPRRMTLCNVLAVLYYNGKKFRPLTGWELRHFQSGEHPIFLDKQGLKQTLNKLFKHASLSLGILTSEPATCSCPAWQIETEQGKFFIPWHNGMIIEDSTNFSFEEKEFDEVKKSCYSLLSFSRSLVKDECYKIHCC